MPAQNQQIDWWEKVYAYAERGDDPAFWAEPLNAWSNGAFWVAAAIFAVYLVAAGKPHAGNPAATPTDRGPRRDLWVLDVLLVFVGAGSFIFHTFAYRWTGTLDVVFIVFWVYFCMWVVLRRVVRWGRLWTSAFIVTHLLSGIGLAAATGWFRISYLPTAITAYMLAVYASRFPLPGRRWLWASAIVFTVSITMSIIDLPLAQAIPTGTHFLWHIFNATALLLGSIGLATCLTAKPALATAPSAEA